MDMEFQVGQSVTFGFDVKKGVSFGLDIGGGGAPPEPSHSDMAFTNHPIAIAKTYGHFQTPSNTPCGIATKEE